MSYRRDVAQLPSGTSLEYTTRQPPTESLSETGGTPRKLAICLHPWSWLGGRMNDPVLRLLAEPLLSRGYIVLSYNSRGVGKSTGRASLSGLSEVEDLKELVQWTMTAFADVSSILLLGYSYGSLVASMHPILPDIQISHILLSYPLGPRSWLTAFHGRTYANALEALVREPQSNVLIIYGDADDFTSAKSYQEWAESVERVRQGPELRGKIKTVKIEGASHFWREVEAVTRLVNAVRAWAP